MKSLGKIFISVLFIMLISGCMMVQRGSLKKDGYGPFYPATKADIKLMSGSPLGAGCFGIPIGIIDIPFSFVTDTLFLPFDMIKPSEKSQSTTVNDAAQKIKMKENRKDEEDIPVIVIPVEVTPSSCNREEPWDEGMKEKSGEPQQ